MMPAKLTHTLINIAQPPFVKACPVRTAGGGRGDLNNNKNLIFDPFCGTGTTGFLANALGYHFIGSDIKLNLALQNQQRRKKSHITPLMKGGGSEATGGSDLIFDFFEQDISKPLDQKLFPELLTHNTLIVTEGRLGPVIKQTTTKEEVIEYQRRVKNLYLQFIQTITDFFPKKPPMVFTIPIYIDHENSIEQHISELAQKL